MSKIDYLSDDEKRKYLEILEHVSVGGRFAEILSVVNWRWEEYNAVSHSDPRILSLHRTAIELGRMARRARLEDEAFRRAVEGVEEPVYTASGKLVGYRKRYSDTLLAMLLRAHMPDVYGPPAGMTEAGSPGGPVLVVNIGIRRDQPVETVIAQGPSLPLPMPSEETEDQHELDDDNHENG